MTSEMAWRLHLRATASDGAPGEIIGVGFVATADTALTCAHVVKTRSECWVEPLDRHVPPQLCTVQANKQFLSTYDPNARSHDPSKGAIDIATLELRQPLPSAPLGPFEPPRSGTEIELVGSTRKYRPIGRTEATRGEVSGRPTTGLLGILALGNHPPIEKGYSGTAAVDVHSGRVVGMAVQAEQEGPRAWIIPLASIADYWTDLGDYLQRGMRGDPNFRLACDELRHGHFGDALRRFTEVSKSFPYEVDIHYYRVLAAVGGQRPGGFQGTVIAQMEQLLVYALSLSPEAPHVQALLLLVQEDYYILRGLASPSRRPLPDFGRTSTEHAQEMLRCIHAPECLTWQFLSERANGRQ
jgi:hypothetical protein